MTLIFSNENRILFDAKITDQLLSLYYGNRFTPVLDLKNFYRKQKSCLPYKPSLSPRGVAFSPKKLLAPLQIEDSHDPLKARHVPFLPKKLRKETKLPFNKKLFDKENNYKINLSTPFLPKLLAFSTKKLPPKRVQKKLPLANRRFACPDRAPLQVGVRKSTICKGARIIRGMDNFLVEKASKKVKNFYNTSIRNFFHQAPICKLKSSKKRSSQYCLSERISITQRDPHIDKPLNFTQVSITNHKFQLEGGRAHVVGTNQRFVSPFTHLLCKSYLFYVAKERNTLSRLVSEIFFEKKVRDPLFPSSRAMPSPRGGKSGPNPLKGVRVCKERQLFPPLGDGTARQKKSYIRFSIKEQIKRNVSEAFFTPSRKDLLEVEVAARKTENQKIYTKIFINDYIDFLKQKVVLALLPLGETLSVVKVFFFKSVPYKLCSALSLWGPALNAQSNTIKIKIWSFAFGSSFLFISITSILKKQEKNSWLFPFFKTQMPGLYHISQESSLESFENITSKYINRIDFASKVVPQLALQAKQGFAERALFYSPLEPSSIEQSKERTRGAQAVLLRKHRETKNGEKKAENKAPNLIKNINFYRDKLDIDFSESWNQQQIQNFKAIFSKSHFYVPAPKWFLNPFRSNFLTLSTKKLDFQETPSSLKKLHRRLCAHVRVGHVKRNQRREEERVKTSRFCFSPGYEYSSLEKKLNKKKVVLQKIGNDLSYEIANFPTVSECTVLPMQIFDLQRGTASRGTRIFDLQGHMYATKGKTQRGFASTNNGIKSNSLLSQPWYQLNARIAPKIFITKNDLKKVNFSEKKLLVPKLFWKKNDVSFSSLLGHGNESAEGGKKEIERVKQKKSTVFKIEEYKKRVNVENDSIPSKMSCSIEKNKKINKNFINLSSKILKNFFYKYGNFSIPDRLLQESAEKEEVKGAEEKEMKSSEEKEVQYAEEEEFLYDLSTSLNNLVQVNDLQHLVFSTPFRPSSCPCFPLPPLRDGKERAKKENFKSFASTKEGQEREGFHKPKGCELGLATPIFKSNLPTSLYRLSFSALNLNVPHEQKLTATLLTQENKKTARVKKRYTILNRLPIDKISSLALDKEKSINNRLMSGYQIPEIENLQLASKNTKKVPSQFACPDPGGVKGKQMVCMPLTLPGSGQANQRALYNGFSVLRGFFKKQQEQLSFLQTYLFTSKGAQKRPRKNLKKPEPFFPLHIVLQSEALYVHMLHAFSNPFLPVPIAHTCTYKAPLCKTYKAKLCTCKNGAPNTFFKAFSPKKRPFEDVEKTKTSTETKLYLAHMHNVHIKIPPALPFYESKINNFFVGTTTYKASLCKSEPPKGNISTAKKGQKAIIKKSFAYTKERQRAGSIADKTNYHVPVVNRQKNIEESEGIKKVGKEPPILNDSFKRFLSNNKNKKGNTLPVIKALKKMPYKKLSLKCFQEVKPLFEQVNQEFRISPYRFSFKNSLFSDYNDYLSWQKDTPAAISISPSFEEDKAIEDSWNAHLEKENLIKEIERENLSKEQANNPSKSSSLKLQTDEEDLYGNPYNLFTEGVEADATDSQSSFSTSFLPQKGMSNFLEEKAKSRPNKVLEETFPIVDEEADEEEEEDKKEEEKKKDITTFEWLLFIRDTDALVEKRKDFQKLAYSNKEALFTKRLPKQKGKIQNQLVKDRKDSFFGITNLFPKRLIAQDQKQINDQILQEENDKRSKALFEQLQSKKDDADTQLSYLAQNDKERILVEQLLENGVLNKLQNYQLGQQSFLPSKDLKENSQKEAYLHKKALYTNKIFISKEIAPRNRESSKVLLPHLEGTTKDPYSRASHSKDFSEIIKAKSFSCLSSRQHPIYTPNRRLRLRLPQSSLSSQNNDPESFIDDLDLTRSHKWWQKRRIASSLLGAPSKRYLAMPELTAQDWRKIVEWQLKTYFLEEEKRIGSLVLEKGVHNTAKNFFKLKKIAIYLPWTTLKKSLNKPFEWPLTGLSYQSNYKFSQDFEGLLALTPEGLRAYKQFAYPDPVGVKGMQIGKRVNLQKNSFAVPSPYTFTHRICLPSKNSVLTRPIVKKERNFLQNRKNDSCFVSSISPQFKRSALSCLKGSRPSYSVEQNVVFDNNSRLLCGHSTCKNMQISITKKQLQKNSIYKPYLFEQVTEHSHLFLHQLLLAVTIKQFLYSIYKVFGKIIVNRIKNSGLAIAFLPLFFNNDSRFNQVATFYALKKRFKDLAGSEHTISSLSEIVWYLRNSCRGRMVPRGVVLVESVSSESTDFLKAIGGEAQVPVIVQSLRALPLTQNHPQRRLEKILTLAQKKAPCILFLDDLDAIGQSRTLLLKNNLNYRNGLRRRALASTSTKRILPPTSPYGGRRGTASVTKLTPSVKGKPSALHNAALLPSSSIKGAPRPPLCFASQKVTPKGGKERQSKTSSPLFGQSGTLEKKKWKRFKNDLTNTFYIEGGSSLSKSVVQNERTSFNLNLKETLPQTNLHTLRTSKLFACPAGKQTKVKKVLEEKPLFSSAINKKSANTVLHTILLNNLLSKNLLYRFKSPQKNGKSPLSSYKRKSFATTASLCNIGDIFLNSEEGNSPNRKSSGEQPTNTSITNSNLSKTEEIIEQRRVDLMLRLLTVMDGITHLNGVLIVTTSKNPSLLDPALLRPGRFERLITLNLPNKKRRIELLKVQTSKIGYTNPMPWEYFGTRTKDMTGTEIASAINHSAFRAIIQLTAHTFRTLEYGISCVNDERFTSYPFELSKALSTFSQSNVGNKVERSSLRIVRYASPTKSKSLALASLKHLEKPQPYSIQREIQLKELLEFRYAQQKFVTKKDLKSICIHNPYKPFLRNEAFACSTCHALPSRAFIPFRKFGEKGGRMACASTSTSTKRSFVRSFVSSFVRRFTRGSFLKKSFGKKGYKLEASLFNKSIKKNKIKNNFTSRAKKEKPWNGVGKIHYQYFRKFLPFGQNNNPNYFFSLFNKNNRDFLWSRKIVETLRVSKLDLGNWYRLYLPRTEQNKNNREWLYPDKFFNQHISLLNINTFSPSYTKRSFVSTVPQTKGGSMARANLRFARGSFLKKSFGKKEYNSKALLLKKAKNKLYVTFARTKLSFVSRCARERNPLQILDLHGVEKNSELSYQNLLLSCSYMSFQNCTENRELLDLLADHLIRFKLLRFHEIIRISSFYVDLNML